MMIDWMAKAYADLLVRRRIISPDEYETQQYGAKMAIVFIINYGSIIVTAIILKSFVNVIIYFAFYIPLRNKIGGWHASTPVKCGLLGIFIWIICVVSVRILEVWTYMVFPIIGALATIIVIVFAPAEMIKKEKDILHLKQVKSTSLLIILLQFAVLCIIYFANSHLLLSVLSYGSFAMLSASIMMLIQKLHITKSRNRV